MGMAAAVGVPPKGVVQAAAVGSTGAAAAGAEVKMECSKVATEVR
jgi:hypothetical protein